jgi:hypothetical protein
MYIWLYVRLHVWLYVPRHQAHHLRRSFGRADCGIVGAGTDASQDALHSPEDYPRPQDISDIRPIGVTFVTNVSIIRPSSTFPFVDIGSEGHLVLSQRTKPFLFSRIFCALL